MTYIRNSNLEEQDDEKSIDLNEIFLEDNSKDFSSKFVSQVFKDLRYQKVKYETCSYPFL